MHRRGHLAICSHGGPNAVDRISMSKRSPFWQSFSTQTPLGYSVAGHFNTEPGPNYGSIRFTHVDRPLARPYLSPGMPVFPQPANPAAVIRSAAGDATVDLRAVERLDGTAIAFYPLFDGDGALVEVVPRTRDTVVVADTAWRPLATLVGQARHAGIEEAVRRQRGVFIFQLVGSANPRLISYPFRLRLVLHCVLRGTGRIFATHAQMRSWANQYGLDLPATYAEFDPRLEPETLAAQIGALLKGIEAEARDLPPGRLISTGAMLWASERGSATMLDLPAHLQGETGGLDPLVIWDAMARLADHGIVPTHERVAATLSANHPQPETTTPIHSLDPAWERWSRVYPQAFAAAGHARIAV